MCESPIIRSKLAASPHRRWQYEGDVTVSARSHRVTLYSVALLSVAHFYVVMSFLSVFFALGTKEFWASVAVFIRTGISVLTIDLVYVNEPEIAQLLCDFSKYPMTNARLK